MSEEHALPAPGDEALATENLTIDSTGVPPAAIDSRALDGAPVPDPDLHATTIADALGRGGRSWRCSPPRVLRQPDVRTGDRCPRGSGRRAIRDRAVFIHVEIWRNHQKAW